MHGADHESHQDLLHEEYEHPHDLGGPLAGKIFKQEPVSVDESSEAS